MDQILLRYVFFLNIKILNFTQYKYSAVLSTIPTIDGCLFKIRYALKYTLTNWAAHKIELIKTI